LPMPSVAAGSPSGSSPQSLGLAKSGSLEWNGANRRLGSGKCSGWSFMSLSNWTYGSENLQIHSHRPKWMSALIPTWINSYKPWLPKTSFCTFISTRRPWGYCAGHQAGSCRSDMTLSILAMRARFFFCSRCRWSRGSIPTRRRRRWSRWRL
jgi:hypothetical protein